MAEPKNDATRVTIRSMSDYHQQHPSMKRITSFPTRPEITNQSTTSKMLSRKKFNASSPSLSSSSDEDPFHKNYPRKFRKAVKKSPAPPPPPPPLPGSLQRQIIHYYVLDIASSMLSHIVYYYYTIFVPTQKISFYTIV